MIALQSKFDAPPFGVIDTNCTQDGRFGWFLAIWHPEKNIVLEELNAEIRLAIRNSIVSTISKVEIEKWLKDFFNDLHWKLHAHLRKTDLSEKGISLFFGIIYDHELFFVQYGRMFCAISDNKKLKHIGYSYRDFQMQSLEKLNLLGYAEGNISTRPHRIFIEEHHRFVVVSGNIAPKVFGSVTDLATLDHYIESYSQHDNPLWLVLDGRARLLKPKSRKLSRVQISSLVLIGITILAIIYIMFGNRSLDQILHRTRLSVKNTRTLRLDQIPNTLSIDTQNLLKYMERIVNLPARNIELEIIWSAYLPYSITSAPVFSLDTIFLTADKNLIAFNKKSRELIWKKSFDEQINSVMFNDGTLLVCLQNNTALGFKEDGTEVWKESLACPDAALVRLSPVG